MFLIIVSACIGLILLKTKLPSQKEWFNNFSPE